MMKEIRVAVISANLGNYDPVIDYVPQKVDPNIVPAIFRLNDSTFLPRPKAMTSRLMAGMPKMLGWQFYPGYDYYIWVDASCSLQNENSIMWFMDKIIGYDFAFFQHPNRNTIYEEYEFVKKKISEGSKYLCSRYQDEWLDGQMVYILEDKSFVDDSLYASTAFIYKNTKKVQNILKEWWFHKTRFLLHDQLALPYVVRKGNGKVNVIPDNYLKCDYLTYTRNRGRK
jgi:hypothetical protein